VYASDDGTTIPKGASKRNGLEWNNRWIAKRWMTLDADFAWTRARFANMDDNGLSGNLIPNAVSRVALIRAAVHDLGSWTAGLEARYIGPYPLVQDGSLRAPSAIVANLRVQRAISADLTVSVDAMNVFDRKYFDIAYGQSYQVSANSPLVPSGTTVHPGEPRELRLTLHFKF
jgi:outer membrane receptor protein involved in Fe transport